MPVSRSTSRAIAASVALVIAGGTLAGAAVFHLPILGFGKGATANAAETRAAQPVEKRVVVRSPKPRVVLRTRYVNVVVHRRAARPLQPSIGSVGSVGSVGWVPASYAPPLATAPATTRPTAPARTPAYTAPAPTTVTTIPAVTPEREPEDDSAPPSSGVSTTTTTEPNEVDR
jgi:hypothetical protein